MHRTLLLAAAGLLVLFAAASSLAREAMPTEWPLDRIVGNLEQRLKESPGDAQTHYNLGRAHAFAFSLKRSTLVSFDGESVADLYRQDRPALALDPRVERQPLDEAALPAHLAEGVRHLRRASALDPVQARFHLTLAWLLEIGAPTCERVDTPAVFELTTGGIPSERADAIRHWFGDLCSSDGAAANKARDALTAPENLEQAVPLLALEATYSEPQRQRLALELLKRYWLERAIAEYTRALDLAFDSDLTRVNGPKDDEELHRMVSYEALEGYRRLVEQRGARGPEEERRLAGLDEKQKQLDERPRSGFVTPMVVSRDGCKSLDELVTPALTVPFDLDGDCLDELWPWLAPDAGWLVWDPQHRGEITSGRQLFGSASGWLFFEDGYRVLDALDDDRDGELRGPELAGIAVWFDRDSDGVSDRGEVVPVEALGIVALATTATERIGASLGNPGGLELADGRTLPTYDWVLESRSSP